MNLTVKDIERIWLDVPFRPVPQRNMIRELPHWTIFELCKVTLECGVIGVGETMQFYTWGNVTDESVDRALGRPATETMWDDTLGAGLQMALFEAVGKAVERPLYELLGQKVRTLTNEIKNAGTHTLKWNGLDEVGQSVSTGIYLYRLTSGAKSITKKMALMK